MKENNKKKRLALLISLLAFVVFTGSLLAFFSDLVNGDVNVTAGTLDIEGEYEVYYYYNGENEKLTSTSLTNFNPGDYLVVKATITNSGTKSAWIRDSITLSGDLLDVTYGTGSDSVISVYEGEVTSFDTTTPLSLDSNGNVTSAVGVINGSVENEAAANGVDTYEVVYTIYFNKQAGNDAQAKDIAIDFKTEALQYRNNASPTADTWSTVEAYSVTTQP